MKIKILLSLVIILVLRDRIEASTFTNLVVAPGGTASFVVRTGQLARVISAKLILSGFARIRIEIDGKTFDYTSINNTGSDVYSTQGPPAMAGPATITLTSSHASLPAFCAIELLSPTEPFTPSNAVVIPADSGGPVNIILESSTDLITWTAALPGSYGTSTEKRFFRVRAERTP